MFKNILSSDLPTKYFTVSCLAWSAWWPRKNRGGDDGGRCDVVMAIVLITQVMCASNFTLLNTQCSTIN